MNDHGKKYTFWQLVSDYKIEIPMIQRDYAQGREDGKTKELREIFVADLISAILPSQSNPLPLQLDFIYGSKVDEKLILIDGQQRITTLFLLHWYVSMRASVFIEKINTEKLNNFQYSTRKSSQNFCEKLIKNGCLITSDSIADAIKNSSWFRNAWLADPTIRSMLVMLDEIHRVFNDKFSNDCTWEKCWEILTDKDVIHFYFIEIKNFGAVDDLYIKMNARGKSLSDFENFKAWLQKYVEDKKISLPDEKFWDKFDKEWTDVFWRFKNKDTYEVDNLFLSFFRSVLIFAIARKNDTSLASLIGNLHDGKFVQNQELEPYIDDKLLSETYDFLNFLHSDYEAAQEYIGLFVNKDVNKKIEYEKRVLGYAYLACSIMDDFKGDEVNKHDWLRMTENLVKNTTINKDNLHSAICSLDDIASDCCSSLKNSNSKRWILAAVANKQQEIKFFNDYQKQEERIKAKLILGEYGNGDRWENAIYKAEANKFFVHQICFIIKFSEKKIDDFTRYEHILSEDIFGDGKLWKSDDFLLQRALLCLGDYLLPVGSNHTFLNGQEDWRKFFRSDNKAVFLKQFLDECDDFSTEGVKGFIFEKKSSVNKEFRYLLVECPSAIRECGKRNIRKESDDLIWLLESERKRTYRELRSFFFYEKFIKDTFAGDFLPFKNKGYHSADYPCAVLDKWQEHLALDIKFDGLFVFELFSRIKDPEENIKATLPISQCLIEFGFALGNKRFSLRKGRTPEEAWTFLRKELLPKLRECDAEVFGY